MNSNPIEDILIDHTPKKEKKKGRGMLWILIFLFVVGLILGAGYFYYQRTNIIGNKENFFEGFKNTKLGFYTTNNVIEQMGQNFLDVNSEVITNVKLTNSLELPEKLQGIDLAKLVFDIKTRNSVRLNTANTDVTVSYSDNEIAKFRLIEEAEKVAVTSPDLIVGYVGFNKDYQDTVRDELKLPKAVKFSKNDVIVGKISNEPSNKEVRNAKIEEYINYIKDNIELKKFSANSNYILQKQSGETINVKAYKLSMSKVEAETMIKTIVSKINQDTELKDALVERKEAKELTPPAVYNQTLEPEEPVENRPYVDTTNTSTGEVVQGEDVNFNVELRLEPRANLEDEVGTEASPDTELEGAIVPGEETEEPASATIEEETEVPEEELPANLPSIPIDLEKPEEAAAEEEKMVETIGELKEKEETNYLLNIIGSVVLNRKLALTDEENQAMLSEISKFLTDGTENFEITVYASDEKTEKISIKLPSGDTIEIEFNVKSDTSKTMIITYLTTREDAKLWTLSKEEENVEPGVSKGFKLTFDKELNNASFSTKLEYDWIKGKEITSKIKCDLITKGTANSKKFTTDGTVYYTTSKGELKATVTNEIVFDGQVEIEILEGQNAILLDTIPVEERTNLLNDIKSRIDYVIESIKNDINFIDKNSSTSLIDGTATRPNQFTKEESTNALIEAITIKMNNAVDSGREYTLLELPLLQVPGHTIGVSLEGDFANVSIDGYRFIIDKDFNLSEAE